MPEGWSLESVIINEGHFQSAQVMLLTGLILNDSISEMEKKLATIRSSELASIKRKCCQKRRLFLTPPKSQMQVRLPQQMPAIAVKAP